MAVTLVLLAVSVFVGAIFGKLFSSKGNLLKYLLAFSGAFVFSISILHLFPLVFSEGKNIGVFVLAGFFIQLTLEFFSKGLEHGHLHGNEDRSKPMSMILALWLHAFLEGMPVGAHHHQHEHGILDPFILGLLLHKLPIGMIFYLLLEQLGFKRIKLLSFLIIFALAAPLGSYLANALPFFMQYTQELMALVLGILLHISTTILFESSSSHSFNKIKLFIVVSAAILAYLSNI